jgi:hypothetical protein
MCECLFGPPCGKEIVDITFFTKIRISHIMTLKHQRPKLFDPCPALIHSRRSHIMPAVMTNLWIYVSESNYSTFVNIFICPSPFYRLFWRTVCHCALTQIAKAILACSFWGPRTLRELLWRLNFLHTAYLQSGTIKSNRCKSLVLIKAPRHADVWWSGGIAPRILNLGTRWRSVVSFTPLPLFPQERTPVPIG